MILSPVFEWLAILCVGVALFFLARNLWRIRACTMTKGHVRGYREVSVEGADDSLLRMTVTYKTIDGKTKTVETVPRTSFYTRRINEEVSVYYDPKHQDIAYIVTLADFWWPVPLFAGLAILFVLMGLA